MKLTEEEKAILNGEEGHILQKIMKSVVLYGEAFDADMLIPITGKPHHFMSMGISSLKPFYKMMDEIIDAGLTSKFTFTVDPKPVDYENLPLTFFQKQLSKVLFSSQGRLEEQLKKIGLEDENSFTCTCYLPEIGNIPDPGAILCWAESSAVVYANSVLGARTNRNSAGIDFFCNILGKAPHFGLLTDDGRKADWHIELKTSQLPNPQVLGSVIGFKVVEEVPYISGLDVFLKNKSSSEIRDYFKDMGASSASNGAVGLFHVENMTPEAKELKGDVFRKNVKTYTIDDNEISRVRNSYPVLWKKKNMKPYQCLIGCPHLSLEQLFWWNAQICETLKKKHIKEVSVKTVLCAAPAITDKFKSDTKAYSQSKDCGIILSPVCPLAHMLNPLCSKKPIITNSNKLRKYSTARFYTDDELLDIITK
ncbi:MAG: DUF521 domain-containing protein [Desulfobacterales bacterium]|nr:DUF521 domain-containing protein [Desulfobacterales bacterium]